MFLPEAEKRIAKLVSLRDSVTRFYVLYFIVLYFNNVICACHEQLPTLCDLAENQETRKRIGLNSHCCP